MLSSLDRLGLGRNTTPSVATSAAGDSAKQPGPQYVVAQGGETGPYLDEHGRPQDDLQKAKLHTSAAMAGIYADQATRNGNDRDTAWRVIPAPDDHDPDGDSYNAAKADAAYGALSKRAA